MQVCRNFSIDMVASQMTSQQLYEWLKRSWLRQDAKATGRRLHEARVGSGVCAVGASTAV